MKDGRSRRDKILFPPLPYSMRERVRAALDDPELQGFIESTTVLKDSSRRRMAEETFGADLGPLRDLAARIKQHALDHLDHYLDLFIERATAAGACVHAASDAEEANDICLEIARAEGVRTCVKVKSMLTEETGLLGAFEAAGIETWETDLGEFILQLDHDAPSHIVAPMIHKNRSAVGRAFERELGAPYTDDPQELTAIARRTLRETFRRAQLGVSGANALVAENGSVVVCTNEGNGRFCTTTPRVHVVVAGIEKMVPDLEGLAVLLKLLARSSTAQPLTVYTQILTGPRRPAERDGPERMHIVLLDNGRTRILADPEFRSALRCIRCGACLNACPVYRKIGGHAYGGPLSGPVGAVVTPLLRGLANYRDLPQASSLCGACLEACPVRIDLPGMLVRLRALSVSGRIVGWRERFLFKLYALSLRTAWTYALAGWLQRRWLGALAGSDGFVRRAPWPVGAWTSERDLPRPAPQSFRAWWAKREREGMR